ncbi:MAG: thioredoxin family protein [Bryobacterales bacterium]|nr:thioredoxin family protein [Bryobacterales bacterium]MBV9398475.1 thioredoxin family protein [Bryobacterales bacterium]
MLKGAVLFLAFAGLAHPQELVHWSLSSDTPKAAPGSTVVLKLTAKIDPGWHMYSLTTTPPDGPNATTVTLADNPAIDSIQVYQPKADHKFDPNFKFDTETFSNEAVFVIPAKLKPDAPSGPITITAQTRYQTCNDTECKRPKKSTADFTLTLDPAAPALAAFAAPPGYALPGAAVPVSQNPDSQGLTAFALTAFGVGLLSIFTPCVFPMIPITVSFFLNQRGGFVQALVFSLGIVVLFCALGLGVTAAVGPFGIAQLGSNPWVNGFIAVVFGIFATSLLGAFEITLPSGLLTKLDRASRRGGYLGTLLMGLTFSLTSFACVGPFVGSLLVSSVQSKGVQPVVGMLSFAIGLASPFFFLAAFPGYLKKLPRSGGWLARVKVVMGFVLLALMLKYFSNIDQVLQTGFLTRERFLAAWFVLFALPGLYLLGLLRLEGIEAGEKLGIGRLLVASLFLIFAFSLLPGMYGAPLGELDAYVPAPSGSASAATAGSSRVAWMKNQYREGLELARKENKLVLVNFTGYSCTNCKWMDANMFPRPEIAEAVKELVPVELYVDGTDAPSEQNQKLEDEKFNTATMPYYVLMGPDENIIAQSGGLTRDPQKFLAFLKTRPGA